MSAIDAGEVLARFPDDAAWTVHQLDWARERALVVRLDRATLRAASFLDERVLSPQVPGFWAPLASIAARAAQAPRRVPHAIFHIGHCGSTLLARQLEAWPRVLSLREPLVLRHVADFVDDARDGRAAPLDRARAGRWLDDVLALLARPLDGDEHVIVKATSSGNDLVAPWLARSAATRAVLLWIPLDEYLATILKSPDARADCRRFARRRWQVLLDALGDAVPALSDADTATIVALGWLAEVMRFDALARADAQRLRLVEFGALLDGGARALGEVARHLGLDGDDATALAAARAPAVQGRYAKATEHAYDADARRADLAESRRRHGAEIDAGLAAVSALVDAHAVLAPLRARLHR